MSWCPNNGSRDVQSLEGLLHAAFVHEGFEMHFAGSPVPVPPAESGTWCGTDRGDSSLVPPLPVSAVVPTAAPPLAASPATTPPLCRSQPLPPQLSSSVPERPTTGRRATRPGAASAARTSQQDNTSPVAKRPGRKRRSDAATVRGNWSAHAEDRASRLRLLPVSTATLLQPINRRRRSTAGGRPVG